MIYRIIDPTFTEFTIFLLHMYWFGMIIKIGTYYRLEDYADLVAKLAPGRQVKRATCSPTSPRWPGP